MLPCLAYVFIILFTTIVRHEAILSMNVRGVQTLLKLYTTTFHVCLYPYPKICELEPIVCFVANSMQQWPPK